MNNDERSGIIRLLQMKGEFIMVDFSSNLEMNNVPLDVQEIAETFNKAISNKHTVEIRIEDLPRMDMDSVLKTKITGVQIDEESKCLHIEASGLHIMFKYESCYPGTQSSSHSKFYFKSNVLHTNCNC